MGEVDLLAVDSARRRYVLVEVRGRKGKKFRPALTLRPSKIRRLKLLARILQRELPWPVHLEFVEVLETPEGQDIRLFKIH